MSGPVHDFRLRVADDVASLKSIPKERLQILADLGKQAAGCGKEFYEQHMHAKDKQSQFWLFEKLPRSRTNVYCSR